MSLIISEYGQEKSGKTSFGFSAIKAFPTGMMLHFDFDLGRERAIWRYPDGLSNRIITVRYPEVPNWTMGSGAVTNMWHQFETDYETALKDPQVVALFIDTGTQMHRLNADEYLENYVKKLKPGRHQLQQIEYRIPNSRTRAKYMSARSANKLLIVSHYEADIYAEQFVTHPDGSMTKESVRTGAKTHSGFAEMPYISDQHIQLYLKNVNINPMTGKEQMPPILKTVARFTTPNPPMAMGVEIPDPTYQKVVDTIEMIRKASMVVE